MGIVKIIALGKQSYELEANDTKCLLAIKK